MRSFAPKVPTSYEENEGDIHRAQYDLEDALNRRDYVAAADLQKRLDYCMNVRKHCLNQADRRDKSTELQRLEKERQREEDLLKSRMSQRADALLGQYRVRLDEMERRHAGEIDQLERKYADPRYATPRTSPTLNALLKAEAFYAKKRNFQVAAALKAQADARTDNEFDTLDANVDAEVQARVDCAVKRHEVEKRGFRERLENEKMRMNMETSNALNTLRNKYGKLRRRVLGRGGADPLPESKRKEGRGVYKSLEQGFAPMLDAVEAGNLAPTPPMSARTVKTTGLLGTGRGTFGETSEREQAESAKNPRIRRALERSLNRNHVELV